MPVVPADRHGASRSGRSCVPLRASSPRHRDLSDGRIHRASSECQIGGHRAPFKPSIDRHFPQLHSRELHSQKIRRHWMHPSQIFFSPTGLIPFRKPLTPDPRIDAKLSHVQHSSTYKHGPSRDQAGTRRCVPHVAQRPEPFARHLFFFPGTPDSRDIFRRDPQRASRPAFPRIAYRLPDGHPRALRTCRIPTFLPCEPSRAPDADPPRRFNVRRPVTQILPTHAALFVIKFRLLFHADSGDWQGWGAPDIHDDDGEPRARSPRSSVNLSNDSRRNSIDEPVRRRSVDLRNHGGGEGAIRGLDDPPLR